MLKNCLVKEGEEDREVSDLIEIDDTSDTNEIPTNLPKTSIQGRNGKKHFYTLTKY